MKLKTCLVIFCCSLTVLVYEILIGRIFSIIFSYDILFIIISLAILGLGLGGICFKWLTGGNGHGNSHCKAGSICRSNLFPLSLGGEGRGEGDKDCFGINPPRNDDIIDNALILLPVSLILSLAAITKFFYILGIIACTAISMLPFLLAGLILTGIYSSQPQRSGLLYFLDLSGGAFGCLASFPLVQFLGVTDSIIFISILPAILSLTLYSKRQCSSPIYRGTKITVLLLALGLLFFSQTGGIFEIGPPQLKRAKTPLGTLLSYSKIRSVWRGYTWDVYSRCDLVDLPSQPDRRRIFINGGSEAVMLRNTGGATSKHYEREIAFIPYLFDSNKRTLVIGSGGGKDVFWALMAGAERVTAVEINQAVVNVVYEQREFNGDIYHNPKVQLVIEDGRRFIMQDKQKYDRIVLGLAYSYAFADLGSLAQMENYLYTQEAFDQYFEHLNDGGTLTIFIDYPELLTKFLFTCLRHFRQEGLNYPQAMSRVMVLAKNYWSGSYYALLVKKTPRPDGEWGRIRQLLDAGDVQQLYTPGQTGDKMLYQLADGRLTPEEYISSRSSYHLTPAMDDSPFFLEAKFDYRYKLIFLAGCLLILLLNIVIIYLKGKTEQGAGYYAAYFFLIGMGFMLVEIALTKRFSFYLGYPQLNLGIILAFLLTVCGLGAYFSGKLKVKSSGISLTCGILVLLMIVIRLSLTPFLNHTVAYALPIRVALLLVYLFPTCFLMGMPFPLGLSLAGNKLAADIPWFWGINGIATVIGSTLCVILSMAWGFNTVLYAAAGCYLIAGIIGYRCIPP